MNLVGYSKKKVYKDGGNFPKNECSRISEFNRYFNENCIQGEKVINRSFKGIQHEKKFLGLCSAFSHE